MFAKRNCFSKAVLIRVEFSLTKDEAAKLAVGVALSCAIAN